MCSCHSLLVVHLEFSSRWYFYFYKPIMFTMFGAVRINHKQPHLYVIRAESLQSRDCSLGYRNENHFTGTNNTMFPIDKLKMSKYGHLWSFSMKKA